MTSSVNTAKVKRRKLWFHSIDELLSELDRIEAAERNGKLRTRGNWTAGQILAHVSAWPDELRRPNPTQSASRRTPFKLPRTRITWRMLPASEPTHPPAKPLMNFFRSSKMKPLFIAFGILAASSFAPALGQESKTKTIRALLIAGGCCHDYAKQQEALCKGIQSRANVQVDVYWTDNSSTSPILPLYGKLNWAEEYDVIIHDECASDIKDPAIVNRIVQTHQKIPAVHLHCAMHSFRTGTDAWFKHLGLQSSGHGPQEPIDIQFVDTKHPITATLGNWTTVKEELYNNVKLLDAHPLAVGKQSVGKGDKARVDEAVVVWINESQGARSFSTTIGHNTETVEDARYLELVTRGLLWACGKLNPEYLQPYQGENKVIFIDKTKFKAPTEQSFAKTPEDATLIKSTASSTQANQDGYLAFDGKLDTRWCADGGGFPEWLQLEFEKAHQIKEIEIAWEFAEKHYGYRVDGSIDGKEWLLLLDKSKSNEKNKAEKLFEQPPVKFVRITGVSAPAGSWCSIREVKLQGENIGTLWPADVKGKKGAFVPVHGDALAKAGNTIPRIEKLTSVEEASILKDVHVPEGFEVTVFASPPAVNYPVFVASTVDGTLYVSSDGNGSLGRNPERGRVIRLRDLDGDGRADETKVFCEIDAPRGLVWDHDRLYLMHPPHLSAFIDKDGDGVADEQKILVKNLAFGYDKRPADHTTNGVSIGTDGWLYIAGGDFGFIDAEGTDGRKVTHRGGGVIRVRPDGTGLEVYSTGTRNILEVAISPQMDMFARDNTNDGGGWDVRMHHFTGMDDHGYPRLYKNFPNESVQPLADYGGGSGCGAAYIDEPGFGKWNNAPFTADWGTGSLYRHAVSPRGATFEETDKPESFIKMTRPTDADVDGNSRVYCASWRGATFDWAGPDVGYIVRVKPKGLQPAPMPNFTKATDNELIEQMKSNSYRRRIESQRELMRRGNMAYLQLLDAAIASRSDLRNLVSKLQTVTTDAEIFPALFYEDPVVVHTAIRCLAKRNAFAVCLDALHKPGPNKAPILRALGMMHQREVVDGLIALLPQVPSDYRREILSTLCRLHFQEGPWKGDSWGTRPDTRGPYYQPEPWSESNKIARVLKESLDSATPDDAAYLIETMQRNRMESNDSLDRILKLAQSNEWLLGTAISQLTLAKDVPNEGMELLLRAVEKEDASTSMLSDAVIVLSKQGNTQTPAAILTALSKLNRGKESNNDRNRARDAFVNSVKMDTHVATFENFARASDTAVGIWADAGLIAIASRKNGSPETQELAQKAIETAWQQSDRRERLMQAASEIGSHFLDSKILQAVEDPDAAIAKAAKSIVRQMKIQPQAADKSPKIGSLSLDDLVAKVVESPGDATLGKEIFAKANCAACHTVRQDEVQKGPYLGTIAKTYKRPDLMSAILEPSKTIAQGFITNLILTKDGELKSGFVTSELTDRVTIRDQKGAEFTVMKEDIEERKTSPTSVMPTGVMNEFSTHELSSLLDYLESLAP